MTNEPSAPQTEGKRPTVERGGLWGVLFSTAALLLPPYGIVLSVFGIVQGSRARRSGKTGGVPAPGAVLSIVIGTVGVLWSLLMGATMVVFSDELSAQAECTARANTVSAQEQCDKAYQEAIEKRFAEQPWLSRWVEATSG